MNSSQADNCAVFLSFLQVEFQICESRKNNTKNAVSIRTLSSNNAAKQYGFIATLKDSFGFIEMADHEKEVFFHFR